MSSQFKSAEESQSLPTCIDYVPLQTSLFVDGIVWTLTVAIDLFVFVSVSFNAVVGGELRSARASNHFLQLARLASMVLVLIFNF